MRRTPLLVISLLFFVAIEGWRAHAAVPQGTAGRETARGSWSASNRAGLTLGGTWTATPDPKTGAVTGTWTLIDEKGTIVRRGAWSAAKSPKGWTGAWRAAVSGSKGEYAGTWSADVDLEPDVRFADLFELAVKTVVSGAWRAGRQSGAWSIRASD